LVSGGTQTLISGIEPPFPSSRHLLTVYPSSCYKTQNALHGYENIEKFKLPNTHQWNLAQDRKYHDMTMRCLEDVNVIKKSFEYSHYETNLFFSFHSNKHF